MDKGNDLNGVVQTIKELEDSRNQFMCENRQLAEQMTELENEVEEMENIHREDMAHVEDLEANIAALTRDNKQLQNTAQAKDLEIQELRSVAQDAEEMRRENEGILKDLQYAENQTSQLNEIAIKKEEALDEKKHTITKLENQIARTYQKMDDYRKMMDSLAQEIECLLKRNEECKKSMEVTAQEIERLSERIRLTEASRLKMEECSKRNIQVIKHLKVELARESGVGCKMGARISTLEEENNKAKREVNHLREEIATLREELEEEQNEIDKCRAELKRKIQEFENYKNTITSLKDKIMNNRNNTPLCPMEVGARSTTRRARFQSQPPGRNFNCSGENETFRNKTTPCTRESAPRDTKPSDCRSRNTQNMQGTDCTRGRNAAAEPPRKRCGAEKRNKKCT